MQPVAKPVTVTSNISKFFLTLDANGSGHVATNVPPNSRRTQTHPLRTSIRRKEGKKAEEMTAGGGE